MELLEIFILSIAFACLSIYIKLKYLKSRKERILLKVPGPAYNFLFGNTLAFIGKREDRFIQITKVIDAFPNSPLVRVWIGRIPNVFITKAKAAEELLSSTRWIRKGFRYEFVRDWLGDGLLISDGAKWKTRRRMITPTFHFGILKTFLLTMNEQGVKLAQVLKSQHLGEKAFDFYPYSSRCTLDTICATAMGYDLNSQTMGDTEYVKAVGGLTEAIIYRHGRPWLYFDQTFKLTKIGKMYFKCLGTVHDFTKMVIKTRMAEYAAHKAKGIVDVFNMESNEVYGMKERTAFLDFLLRSHFENEDIDEQGIQEEVDTFMFEGHDTTASGLSWLIFNIGRYPTVQNKIQEELNQVLGPEEVDKISHSQLSQMKYLECVIKESLRLYPPVPFHSRQLLEDIKFCGYDIPSGTVLQFMLRSIHTDPKVFPNPFTFDPDRFLPANDSHRHPFAFLPFSGGPRNCIGQRFAMMELKTLAAHIIHRFWITSSTDQDIKLISEFVLRPSNGHYIQLKRKSTVID